MAFFLPDQNYVGNTYKSIEFQEGKFVEFTYSFMENKNNWHYFNPMSEDQIEQARKELS